MCGICGIINFNKKFVNHELLKKMNNLLYHRGPDGEGYYLRSKVRSQNGKIDVGLGMKRLSIIDLAGGSQPIYSEDKNIVIVFNGEIYNFLELKEELVKRHRFYTNTDTEVIVHLYEDYGCNCVKYLRGMFAFAIWDEKKKRLFFARDRMGQKPLYYTWLNGNFYFASEMKSFLPVPEFKKEINLKAIDYYLTYQYIPSPMTIWKNVWRLEPANSLVLNKEGKIKIEKYWDIDFRKKTKMNFEEAKEKTRELLKEATKLRMISDVPLGAFLSGGLDSSIIVGLMSELSDKPVKTFSIGFEEKEFCELKYARIIANLFHTDHHELIVKPDYIDVLPEIVWHYDQPYADASALPSYYVAKMTRKHVKVALNGDGGDENLAGYLRYKAMKISQMIAFPFKIVPSGVIKFLLKQSPANRSVDAFKLSRYIHRFIQPLKEPPQRRNLIWNVFFTNELKNFVYSREMKEKFRDTDAYSYLEETFLNSPADSVIDSALYTDLTTYLPECLLVKMDIATMANSLEARSPFLDHKFIEFVAGLPDNWKLKGLKSKYILKETFKSFLPPEILHRRKKGFSVPFGEWFRGKLKNHLKDVVLSTKALKRGYFNPDNLRQLISDHIEGRANYGSCLWALLMLELWHIKFIDEN